MCGICGIINFDPDCTVTLEAIRSLTNTLAHRGPDDEGYFIEKNVALGHRRLAIIDLERGHQPMYNEDRSIVIVCNGEIYNFQEIRAKLNVAGHRFVTESDTEVLLHGYEEWGMEGLLAQCNGMFAFCLYDTRQGLSFLVRDRLGKKPLYYALQPERLLFSSEIRGLVTQGFVAKEISVACLNHYVRLHFPYGEESMIRGVKRVLPGEYLTLEWRRKKATIKRYWTLEARKIDGLTFVDYVERLRFLVRDSVRLRRIADVRVGTFLSGGLDSSIVTGLLAEIVDPLSTYSIGFREGGFDESQESRLVASRFGTDHHHFVLTLERFAELLQEIAARIDEPVADAASIPTFWLSHEARKQVKVVLTGEGSDELFAGYDQYRPFLSRKPTPGDRPKQEISADDDDAVSRLSGLPFALSETLHRRILSPEYRCADSLDRFYKELQSSYRQGDGSRLDQAQMADIRSWLVDDVLMKLDKMSMLNSLEARAPFLDYRLVEFALSVPDEYRIREGVAKYILRESFSDLLPRIILERRKQGFGLPLNEWFRDGLSQLLADYLSSQKIREHGFFHEQTVSEILTRHERREGQFGRLLFLLLMFQMWWDAL
jgi:asparagine synthase (glutamine-hydrolysing)